jgi:hypothetical protein
MSYHLRHASAIEAGFARRSINEGGLAKTVFVQNEFQPEGKFRPDLI